MDLLNTAQLHINPQIKETIESDVETYKFNIQLIYSDEADSVPLLYFAQETLNNYPKLIQKLAIQNTTNEFIVNCYYYLIMQNEHYSDSKTPSSIAGEFSRHDLKEILKSYNS